MLGIYGAANDKNTHETSDKRGMEMATQLPANPYRTINVHLPRILNPIAFVPKSTC
jgi:hypothetical protein